MKIIFGLGNPGKKYIKTRHNAGFLFLDFLAAKFGFSEFKTESKFKAEIAEGTLDNEKVLLIKPQTFMNLSGQTVQTVVNFYKITKADFVIVFDDKDLHFGKVRFRKSGSSGGHNGIKSILNVLGEDFKRLKIGVANRDLPQFQDTADFVLAKFKQEEWGELAFIFEEAWEMLKEEL